MSLDGTSRTKPVSTLRAVTVTPGSAPPLASRTVPTMVAVVTWAPAAGASGNAASQASSATTMIERPAVARPPADWIPIALTCIEASTCVNGMITHLFFEGTIFLSAIGCQAKVMASFPLPMAASGDRREIRISAWGDVGVY